MASRRATATIARQLLGGVGAAGSSASSSRHGARRVAAGATRWTSSSAIAAAREPGSTSSSAQASAGKSSPTSSSSGGAQWKPALPRGVEPAYDAALDFLQQHKEAKLAEAKALADQPGRVRDAEDALIEAFVDDPETRWRFASGDVDLSQPVHRFLREHNWRKNGALERLLERVRLMKVVPDVIPTIAPTVDVQVAYGEGAGIGDHGGDGGDIWPGVFLPTAKTRNEPVVTVTPFHTDERKYTLLLVDPDVPDELSMSFTTFVHWHIADVPLSATKNTVSSSTGKVLHSYIPPHPQKGSPYHRYTTLILEQSASSTNGTSAAASAGLVSPPELPARTLLPGTIQSFIETNGLKPVGIHFFRQECTRENQAAVEKIYRDILKTDAPVYGKMPKQDPYRDSAGLRRSRYYSSADELAAGQL